MEIFITVVIFASVCAGATITVNKDGTGDYLKIQDGINAAVDGDTVIVGTGTYLEKIYFGGKNIILSSTNPLDHNVVETTIINYLGVGGSIITFNGSETEDCILTGFTITGGYSLYGGGIRGSYTHATISNCVITGNRADNGGGLHGCYGTISNCTITDNSADNGGGLFICRGTIINCVISLNFASRFGGGLNLCNGKIANCTITSNQVNIAGGGLFCCDGTIQNCTITNNNSTRYGGGLDGCDANIINCIIWGNSAIESGDQMYQIYVIPTYSCIQDWTIGGEGNISSDPLFDTDGIHLTSYSPCIDTGDPDYVAVPGEVDIDGQPRFIVRIDMGVDEFYNSDILLINLTDHRLHFSALLNGSNPDDQSVTIRHYCVPDLNWTIVEDCSWLDVTPGSGVTSYGQEDEITFSVDITGLNIGYYSSEVLVSDPDALNSPVEVTVSLTIRGPKISGYITDTDSGLGISSVLVSTDISGVSDTTDTEGYYEVIVPYGWNGTVTPSKSDWLFTPLDKVYSNVTTDLSDENYSGSQLTISGYVTDGISGMSDVLVSAVGAGSAATDEAGYYEVNVPYGWSGILQPEKTGWRFDPSSLSYINITTDQINDDFVGRQAVISGFVTDEGGIGLEGILVSVNNGMTPAITDINGYYEFILPFDCNVTVTVNSNIWAFVPSMRSYYNLDADFSNQNYTAYVRTKPLGSGTETDPYLIRTLSDFDEFASDPNYWAEGIHMRLECDPNLAGRIYTAAVIAPDTNIDWPYQGIPFAGVFDGAGHKIINLTIDTGGIPNNFLGLFGIISGQQAEVKKLRFENFSITGVCGGSGSDNSFNLGAVCGKLQDATIVDCCVSGSVSNALNAGGLCGENFQGTIYNCFTSGFVTGFFIGGLCGNNGGTISNCYTDASIIGEGDRSYLGGLCGINWDGIINNCYAEGSVIANEYSFDLGGLCGMNWDGIISNCYSTGSVDGDAYLGGLCASNDGTIDNCFWDIDTSGRSWSAGGIGLPTEDMQKTVTFAAVGWDFVGEDVNGTNDIWRMCADDIDYPRLSHEYSINGDFTCPDGVGTDDLLSLSDNWLNTEELDPGFNFPCDPTSDGLTNLADFLILAENWLQN